MTDLPRRSLPCIPLALAACGLFLAADALLHGGLLRYRLFGAALGGALLVPLGVAVVFGQRGRRVLRKIAFALVPVTVLLVGLEVAARWLDVVDASQGELVAEPALGYTMRPRRGLADENGFRNAAVPASADVLFVGDSLTWGFGVAAEATFAARFAARTGRSVYNASLGGYGPIQYRELARRMLPLRPRDVVVGLYLGNDVTGALQFAHLDIAADLRRKDYVYPPAEPLPSQGVPPNLAMALVDAALAHSRLFAIAGGVAKDRLRGIGGLYDAEAGVPRCEEPGIATMFAPWWCVPTDLRTDAAMEGLRLTELSLRDIGASCTAANARAWLLLLPTKEAIYAALFAERGAPRGELALAASNGAELARRFVAVATAAGMKVLDPSAELLAGLRAGRALYPRGSDPHPDVGGHEVLAEVVERALTAAAK